MTRTDIAGAQGRLAVYHRPAASPSADAAPLPIVFLHADAGRASQWPPVVERLDGRYEVVSFDFRGHGASEPAANEDYGYEGRAEDVAAVADWLGAPRFVLVAHSGGCAAALAYAARHGGRVAGMLMVDPAMDPRGLPAEVKEGFVRDLAGPNGPEVQQAYYRSIAGADPAVQDRVVADTAVVAPAARAGVGRALADWNPETTLFAHPGPIRLLASPAGDGPGALFRMRGDISHRVIPNVGHWIGLEIPGEVADEVARFVAQVEGGTS